eukprot:scaffold4918_cov90-Skeletonema_dohrnii-CCMP3373.AAC.2
MVLESRAGGLLSCLIRSPTTLYRRPYDQTMLEPVRYDMVLESRAGGRLSCPFHVLGLCSVVLYDSLARVSGRYSIFCYNFLLIMRLECLEHILTSSFVRKYLLDTSNIVNANVRLHSWNGIGLCVMTLLHVWKKTPVKCSVSDEPGCWPGEANPGESMLCATQ